MYYFKMAWLLKIVCNLYTAAQSRLYNIIFIYGRKNQQWPCKSWIFERLIYYQDFMDPPFRASSWGGLSGKVEGFKLVHIVERPANLLFIVTPLLNLRIARCKSVITSPGSKMNLIQYQERYHAINNQLAASTMTKWYWNDKFDSQIETTLYYIMVKVIFIFSLNILLIKSLW